MSDYQSSDQGKNTVLLVAAIASFLTPYMGSSINLALPSIGEELKVSALLLGWVATIYLLSAAVFLVPFGRLGDIYGRRRVFLTGMVVFTFSSLLCAFSPNIIVLLVLRVFQGMGSAMIFATGIAILTSVFPKNERGRAIGITMTSVYAGLSLGPVAGGFLTEYFGWRSVFVFTVIFGIVAIYFVLTKIKQEWAEAEGEPFDFGGAVIYGFSLSFIIYGLSNLQSWQGLLFLLAGLIFFLFFIKRETSVDYPVINVNLFISNRLFAFSNMAAFIHYSSTFAVTFLLSFFLQTVKGFSARDAGLIMVIKPVVMAGTAFLSGRMSDRFEPRVLSTIGMAITATALFFFVFLAQMSVMHIMVNFVLLGVGLGLFVAPNANAIMSSVEKKYVGIASGSMGTMRVIGQMFSMGLVMLVFSVYTGGRDISVGSAEEFLKIVPVAFTLLSALCFAGIYASYTRGNIR